MLSSLTRIKVKSSVVLEATVEDCWCVCRAWGRQPWMPLLPDGTSFDVELLDDFAETEVGAVRCSKFGSGAVIFEQLVAVDDDMHMLKWKLVHSPDAVSPFEDASFVDFTTTLSLHAVTIGNRTFAEWEGQCFTEPFFVDSMSQTMEMWYKGGMNSLKEYMAHHRARKQSGSSRKQLGEHGPDSRQGQQHGRSGRLPHS